jgi:hypothetical protein
MDSEIQIEAATEEVSSMSSAAPEPSCMHSRYEYISAGRERIKCEQQANKPAEIQGCGNSRRHSESRAAVLAN